MVGTISHTGSVPHGGEFRGAGDLDLAGERVRIRDDHGALGTGDLDDARSAVRRLEAEHALADPAAFELSDRADVGGDVDRKLRAQPITDLDGTGGPTLRSDRRHRGERAEDWTSVVR